MDHLKFRTEASGGRRCGWGEEGLTLAELVTTLGLSAIVLLAMAPVMSRLLDVYQLRGAAQQIYGELQRARLAAVVENNRYRLDVDPGSNVYRVHDDDNNDDVDDDGEGTIVSRAMSDSPGVRFDSGDIITFAPDGTAITYGSIALTNASGDTRVVSVAAGGRVRVE
jgi:Tfp pilus assembly protein FimT